ncbi:DNA polymerase III subunit alpha [Aggregatilinea lenta]|uniref:DNA polymerase III subunit alpha n=1 Tax=Aggregatilinea lenta TaxID=913108 RepID=UPI000E5B20E3|nr:DNA polymerase III subunit alpha [Aggregatilinea lenta]
MPDEKPFVHLHVHTEYSLLDGLSHIKRLVKRAQETGMKSLAITDHGTMFGVIDFYRASKAAGIKPIIGMEAYLAPRGMEDRDPQKDTKPYHMLLLAKNQTGYQNLLQLASAAQLKGYYYRPRIDHDFLAAHADGLIATSGCLAAEIPRLVERGQDDDALAKIGWYQDVFGAENFFLELQEHDIPLLRTLNRWLLENRGYANPPLIATNDVHYILEEDFDAHDTLLCIQTGNLKTEQNRLHMSDPSYHLRTPDEMWRLFADVPDALMNTLHIADMCDVNLDSEGYHLPVFPVPDGYTADTYLRNLCERGLQWRYGSRADTDEALKERLDYELGIIHNMGFDTYFLIVWDLCEFARHADIWWNVRGSGAGSVAAYTLGITSIDPLRNGLLFERFLNPGRVSMPDIDMDFPEDRRAEMIQYCAQKYGEDKVAAIITFGTMGSKAAIRDVGRALDMPIEEVNRIARLIPTAAKAIKFDDALSDDPERALPDLKAVYAQDGAARKVIDVARQLEGVTRHASTHAAGIIIADRPLVEYIPLHRPTSGSDDDAPVKQVTQFPMETCESIGLLKVDFLGLSTLTIVRLACDLIEEQHGVRYDLSNIPYRPDPDKPDEVRMIAETFEMLSRGETIGVFQLESQGMRRMLTDMRPRKFENIVAAVALYRPGPMDYIPTYNRRLHGDEDVTYLHPKLEPILEETYGICVFQEQIMQIGAQLFGYSLGEADLMRKAVSKKKKEDLFKHRETFIQRGPDHGVDPDSANRIFDDIEFFARYGFNKCLPEDVEVIDAATGRLVRIGDLASGAASIEHTLTCNTERLRLQPGVVTHVHANGVKPVYRLTTQSGRQIEATANHPFYTFDGWRLLGDLSIGEPVAVPRCIPVEGRRKWPEERLQGLAEEIATKRFEVNVELPAEFFELTNQQLSAFITQLWRTVEANPFQTASARLAHQLQHILSRLIVWSDITHARSGYTLIISEAIAEYSLADQALPVGAIHELPLRRTSASSPLKNFRPPKVDGDIYWDKVVSVEYVADKPTYDLTVADTHNFVANDFIVHNSHAADYAVLTCQTAFLKCHYPHEYMTALMTVHRDDSAKVSLFAADCSRMGIEVLPPNVNASKLNFSIETLEDGKRAIRFGLAAIKNVGVTPLEHIIAQREEDGPFRDLEDFCRRADLRIVQKRALESLIRVGALDQFGTRPTLLAAMDRMVRFSADYHKAQDVGQISLFGDATGVTFDVEQSLLSNLPDIEQASRRDMLRWEKELVGLYVTDHPLRTLEAQFASANIKSSADLIEEGDAAHDRAVQVAGLVTDIRNIVTKKGAAMAILTLEDITGTLSVVMFPRTWEKYRDVVSEDAVIVVRGKADTGRGDVQVIADEIRQEIETVEAVEEMRKLDSMRLSWMDDAPPGDETSYDDETGEPEAPEPAPARRAAGPVMPATAGATVAPIPPVEPPSAPRTVEEPPAHVGPMVSDREMPGWLEADMDNGWTPPPALAYQDDTGHVIGVMEPENGNGHVQESTPDLAESGERPGLSLHPRKRRPKPEPKPAAPPQPSRLLKLTIPRSGDSSRDRAKLRRLHGILTQYPGPDRFCFLVPGPNQKPTRMDFPKYPIAINDDVLNLMRQMVGSENVIIESLE